MSELRSIRVDQIFIPERLRAVEEDHALAIQASIVEHGLLNPITVRSTPNQGKGKTPYTLVAGAHRLRGVSLLDEPEIDAIVVEADALEAQLIEIEENVFRNDLSKLDRAVFIQSYRDVWEQKHGKIDPKGGRPANSANIAQLIQDEAELGFSGYVAERLGLSRRSVEYSNRIATKIPKSLREKLRGTPAADNQAQLLKLTKLEPSKLKVAAKALDQAEGDVDAAIAILEGTKPVKLNEGQRREQISYSNFQAMGRKHRLRMLRRIAHYYRDELEQALADPASDGELE